MSLTWEQPRQNSVESLCYGINHFDGVEFDLRLSSDGVLMLHHDNTTKNGDYVELLSSDELKPFSDRFFNSKIRAIAATPSTTETMAICCGLQR